MMDSLFGPPGLIMLAAILGAIGALWASQQQAQFERELRQKSDEIAELNRRTIDTITGGNSFAYLAVSGLSPETNTGLLVVVHQGDHPLYELHARIVDLEKFDQVKARLSLETMAVADTNLGIGTLPPGYASTLGPFNLGPDDRRRFNIFFTARNGGFTQALRFVRKDGRWIYATRVNRGRSGELLFEKADEDYPRNANGEIEW